MGKGSQEQELSLDCISCSLRDSGLGVCDRDEK